MTSRPHPSPCACDVCAKWARDVVAEPTSRKPAAAPSVMDGDIPTPDFYRAMIAAACKATGMTEDELRAKAEQMGTEYPQPEQRLDRETVVARGVPEIHIRAVFDREPIECEALDAIRGFLAGDKTTLVLAGGVGVRKTGSACWALTQRAGVFVTADECVRLAASRLPDDIEAWRRARNAQVLVIDDLGGEYNDDKGWSVKVFNGLLDHRYASGLKTIITTNLKRDRFKADYGERIADRIAGAGRYLTLGGQSARRAG